MKKRVLFLCTGNSARIQKPRLIAAFVGVAAAGILAVGWFFDAVL